MNFKRLRFKKISFFCFYAMFFFSAQAHVLVFFHLGSSLPPYFEEAVFQASLFNSPNKICVIVNQQALEKPNNLGKFSTIFVAELLPPTARHLAFRKNSTLDKNFRDSFWFYTSERFLYLDDFMQEYNVKDVFHIESDVVLFFDLKDLLPVFQQQYNNQIAAVFDNNDRCIPSFIYASDKDAMSHLAEFMVENADSGKNDMEVLGLYKKQHPTKIKNLPIIPDSYHEVYSLESSSGCKTQNTGKDFVDHKYKFSNDPIDVVIPCIKKDQRTLDLVIAGIKANVFNIRNVYLVAPERLSINATWVSESTFPFTQKDIAMQIFDNDEVKANEYMMSKDSRTGWIYQQLLKFYAPFVIPGISQNVLILDADTVFLRPVKFQAQSGAALFNPSPEYYPPYFEHAQKVIPGFRKIFGQYSGVSHHMLFQRCVLEDLFQTIRNTHNVEPWIALVKNIGKKDLFGSGLSEYEIYFNFLFARDGHVQIRSLKWVESGNINKLQEYKSEGYDYVSFHSNYPASAEFRHIGAEDL